MEILYPCCCGLDVHQRSITACLLKVGLDGKREKEVRTFRSMTAGLLDLADWLSREGCTHVAMESTGVYWKPVYNLLEGAFTVWLINAQHIKAVPGRKTDVKDSEWIAQLLQHGLLRPSFVPPRPIRDLRDLTRHRVKLVQQKAAVVNRIQKILEDANIKLASVASDVLGKSGRRMLDALLAGETDPEKLSDLALKRLRAKKEDLKLALEGRLTDHHRFLLNELLTQVRFLEDAVGRVQNRIEEVMRPFEKQAQSLREIPGVDEQTAQNLLAEMGPDMSVFPTDAHAASWAGICPGHHESAGKRYSGKTRKGSRWLRRALSEAAWAAGKTKDTYLSAQYRRLAARRGKKRAILAVGHSILTIAYHLLKDGTEYRDLGANHFDQLQADRLKQHLVKRLEGLGHKVTLEPVAEAA